MTPAVVDTLEPLAADPIASVRVHFLTLRLFLVWNAERSKSMREHGTGLERDTFSRTLARVSGL